MCVCVCVLSPHLFSPSDFWTYQPGSHRKKVTQGFFHFPSAVLALIFIARRIRDKSLTRAGNRRRVRGIRYWSTYETGVHVVQNRTAVAHWMILLGISGTGNVFFPCPRSRLRIWSRETGLAIPPRDSLFILRTQAEYGACVPKNFTPLIRENRCPIQQDENQTDQQSCHVQHHDAQSLENLLSLVPGFRYSRSLFGSFRRDLPRRRHRRPRAGCFWLYSSSKLELGDSAACHVTVDLRIEKANGNKRSAARWKSPLRFSATLTRRS